MNIEKVKQSPYFIGEVNSGVLNFLPNRKENDIVYTKDTKQVLVYRNNKWVPLKDRVINTGISLMEMNRKVVSQLPCYDADDMSYENILKINSFCVNDEFYMMYGKEISYFTIFQILSDTEPISDAVIECLKNIGKIYSVDLTEDKDAIEIWVRTADGGKTTCLYLFPYDSGIVKVGE